jgi:hypothetical protein
LGGPTTPCRTVRSGRNGVSRASAVLICVWEEQSGHHSPARRAGRRDVSCRSSRRPGVDWRRSRMIGRWSCSMTGMRPPISGRGGSTWHTVTPTTGQRSGCPAGPRCTPCGAGHGDPSERRPQVRHPEGVMHPRRLSANCRKCAAGAAGAGDGRVAWGSGIPGGGPETGRQGRCARRVRSAPGVAPQE